MHEFRLPAGTNRGSSQARPTHCWEAPPLNTDRAGARAAAIAPLASGTRFNRCQTIRLLDLSVTWKRGTPRRLAKDLQLLGVLSALAARGGWRAPA